MMAVASRNLTLRDLLAGATSDELNVLADLITDNGKGRVALDSKVKTTIMTHRSRGKLQAIPDVPDAEIRAFGSNTLAKPVPRPVRYRRHGHAPGSQEVHQRENLRTTQH